MRAFLIIALVMVALFNGIWCQPLDLLKALPLPSLPLVGGVLGGSANGNGGPLDLVQGTVDGVLDSVLNPHDSPLGLLG
ncbi:hypothetical protein DOY81_004824 [Sarcophaga bullata]|nr:hypothetical protein DOY81_004824 [Sarcophaga bullata]